MKITTFKGWGRLKIPISTPVNLADATATYMIATGVIPDDNVIVGDLYDAQDNLIARKRVYSYQGSRKNSPFALHTGEDKYLSGKRPNASWLIETIKLWMDDRQTKDEDGNVSEDDPYYYGIESKEEILERIRRMKHED